MITSLRRSARPFTAVASLALVGVMLAATAAPAQATTFIVSPMPVASGPSPSAPTLAPGLYVQVVDGMIRMTNGGGGLSFAAGQFGFVPSTVMPPVIVPHSPGLQFVPPPVFVPTSNPNPRPLTGEITQTLEMIEAIERLPRVQAAADAAAQAADAAEQRVNEAMRARSDASDAVDEAGMARDDAERTLEDAMAAAAEAAPGDELAAAQAAVLVATDELAAAEGAADRAAAGLVQADADYEAAMAAYRTASALATSTREQADDLARTTKADYDAAVGRVKTLPIVAPPTKPLATEPGNGTPAPLPAGQGMALGAAGFAPGTDVAFAMYSTPVAVAPVKADAGGYAVASFQIPATASGNHTLVAMGVGLNGLLRVLHINIAVTPAAAPPAPQLAESGISVGSGVGFSGALVLAGAMLVLVRRRAQSVTAI